MRGNQNDFNISLYNTDWYSEAAGVEFRVTWGSIELHAASVPHLNFNRVQMSWLYSEIDDIEMRKRAVYAIARAVLDPGDVGSAELRDMWGLIGVESSSPRLADAICTLYNTPPVRVFNKATEINEGYGEVYARLDVNLAMQEAYRAALFTNTVLLYPDWDNDTIRVLTPDYFRLVSDGRKITQLWLIHGSGGHSDTTFEVWTNEYRTIIDHRGETIKSEPNTLGRLPATILKLNRSNDLYGAGITEVAEINAWSNLIALLETRIALFQSYSVGVVANMDFAAGTKLGPGHILKGENVQGESSTAPSFQFVTPSGQFAQLEEFRQKRIRAFVRNQGLPAFLVDEGAGQPPTGAALQVMERELNDKRRQHSYALARAERDLAELLGILGNSRGRRLSIDETQNVSFAQPETVSDPLVQLDYDMKKSLNGLMTPAALAQKYLGAQYQGVSDEEAIKIINANKSLFAGAGELRSTVGGAGAIQSLVMAYESKQVSRDAAVNMAVLVYEFKQEDAEKLFVEPSTELAKVIK